MIEMMNQAMSDAMDKASRIQGTIDMLEDNDTPESREAVEALIEVQHQVFREFEAAARAHAEDAFRRIIRDAEQHAPIIIEHQYVIVL